MKDAGWVAQAAGATLRGDASAPGPSAPSSTRARPGPGDLFVGLPGENADGGEFAAQALGQGAWGALVTPDHAEQDGLRADRTRSARRAPGPRARMAARARREGDRHHRLHRQDLDQGHPARAPAPPRPHARQPREPQHRDRAAAVDPRGAGRHRGPRAGDGDARRGADRRAGGHRRARRGRDRERGPGAPGAAGHGRARGRGQGRAGARPGARRELRAARPRSRCWTPTAATTWTPGPSGRAARSRSPGSRTAWPRWRRAASA